MAVEPCRSSCRFWNAAGHRLLQSSSSAKLSQLPTLPWGRSCRKAEVFGRLARPVKRLNGSREDGTMGLATKRYSGY
jgi:hypothetical protein